LQHSLDIFNPVFGNKPVQPKIRPEVENGVDKRKQADSDGLVTNYLREWLDDRHEEGDNENRGGRGNQFEDQLPELPPQAPVKPDGFPPLKLRKIFVDVKLLLEIAPGWLGLGKGNLWRRMRIIHDGTDLR
jgi:hypothetical protein